MAPALILLSVTLVARIVGFVGVPFLDSWADSGAIGLSAMFVITGLAHFQQPRRDGLIAIVPPQVPSPGRVITLTGILELTGAAGVLIPYTRVAAAVCLGLLLIAMFPANVYAARAQRHPSAPTTPIVPRTLYQLLYLSVVVIVVADRF